MERTEEKMMSVASTCWHTVLSVCLHTAALTAGVHSQSFPPVLYGRKHTALPACRGRGE